ncbi:NAD(P)/FAD-dependent oxidoreductase [Mesorhizobium sp. 10J20-29]
MHHDAIIIGGSFAGLSAATQLARARRSVLVIDAGEPRNRFAEHAHGFLAQDGEPPSAILNKARRQLAAYPTARMINGRATLAAKADGGFEVTVGDQAGFTGSRLILATGITDELPDIPGLAERWGKTVIHCPYCHGYEFGGGPLGVLATGAPSIHQALVVADWGDTTLFCAGAFRPDASQTEQLRQRGVAIETIPLTSIEDGPNGGISARLDDGTHRTMRGLFVAPRSRMAGRAAEQLGCEMTEGMLGPLIKVDDMRRTSIPGCFAAGDAAQPAQSIPFAVSTGAFAGLAAHQSLMFGLPI